MSSQPNFFKSAVVNKFQLQIDEGSKAEDKSKCGKAMQVIPPKIRHLLKFGIAFLLSAIVIVAIFYLVRRIGAISDTELHREADVVENVHRSPVSNWRTGGEEQSPQEEEEGHMQVPIDVFKDMQGKAREYDRLFESIKHRPVTMPPLRPLDIKKIQAKRRKKHPANATEIATTLTKLQKVVDRDRKKISSKEIRYWEPGTEPLRIILVSTWRSGSTFLAGIINSHPGVFQHYEPLHYFGVKQVRSGRDAFSAQQLIHQLLDCRYTDEKYLESVIEYGHDMLSHNPYVYQSCQKGPNAATCYNSTFLSDACKMFPIQLVKTVRMRLNATQLLLNDQKFRTKVIFLVRDPRGVMNSRYSSVKWCSSSPDCSSPSVLCQDLIGDLKVATAFQQLYPKRFAMVKYEDVALNPVDETLKLFSFLGLDFTEDTKSYIINHTTSDKDVAWSTYRKSPDRIDIWKKQLPLEEIHDVQNSCENVMKALKYDLIF